MEPIATFLSLSMPDPQIPGFGCRGMNDRSAFYERLKIMVNKKGGHMTE